MKTVHADVAIVKWFRNNFPTRHLILLLVGIENRCVHDRMTQEKCLATLVINISHSYLIYQHTLLCFFMQASLFYSSNNLYMTCYHASMFNDCSLICVTSVSDICSILGYIQIANILKLNYTVKQHLCCISFLNTS